MDSVHLFLSDSFCLKCKIMDALMAQKHAVQAEVLLSL